MTTQTDSREAAVAQNKGKSARSAELCAGGTGEGCPSSTLRVLMATDFLLSVPVLHTVSRICPCNRVTGACEGVI